MKKLIALLLALALTCSFTACGLSATSDSIQSENNNNNQDNSNHNAPELAFTETVVVDNEYCSIKITKIEDDSAYDFYAKLYYDPNFE